MRRRYGVLSNFKQFLTSLRGRGMKYIFHGTEEEWDALTDEEKDRYDQAELSGGTDNTCPIYVSQKVAEGDMNPVSSDAVYSVVIYIRDQNVLDDWEGVSQSFTAQYDGYYSCSLYGTTTGDWTGLTVTVNGTVIAYGGVNSGNSTMKGSQICLPIKKGDTISASWSAAGVTGTYKARYYKKRDYSDR